MYNITLAVFGDRLKQIREHLKLSQLQLAEKVNCKQNAISNLEKGKGGSITLMFNILNYYSKFVIVDLIFSEKFYLISNNAAEEARKSNYVGIIIEIIKQAEKEHEKALDDVKNNVQKVLEQSISKVNSELSAELNKAVELLK